jgi:PAS domain S-box-containing protein
LGPLFVHTTDAVIVGDTQTGRIASWNPAAERLFGWSAAEAIGQPIEILMPPAIVGLHQHGLALYRHSGRGNLIDSGAPIEVPALTRDGVEIRVELSLVNLDGPGGTNRYVLATLRDTSGRRRADLQTAGAIRAESARQAAEEALRQHHRRLQAGAADLQRELARLQRSAERLSATARIRPERPDVRARVVESRTRRVRCMLDELAAFEAAQANNLELRAERVNLVPLLSRVVSDMRARGTRCRVNAALPQGLTALVDPQRIEQVVRTLLEQAVRRNRHGCWIDVELRRPLVGLARIEVRDIGRPISDTVRRQLQDPSCWERGLALSRSVAELHGGTLEVDFPLEGGVRVVVTLPTQRGRVSAGPSQSVA